jgi:hypothetical protein
MSRTWFVAVFITVVFALPAHAADGVAAAPAPSRGVILPALYVSFAALNAYDAASTGLALKDGGIETNPLMRGIAGRPAALWALKGGVTAAAIVAADNFRRQGHRRQAVALMVATNGIMAVVAAHNAQMLQRLK